MSAPSHAPYTDVEVGEEVMVRVHQDSENPDLLTCECVFREDTFGGQADLSGMDRLERMTAIDQLINGVCTLVWNELLGTPVFHEDDEGWWTRVENAKVWTFGRRQPTNGWVMLPAHDDVERVDDADREPEPVVEERDHVAATLGDADVADLKLTQDEMAALMRGEIPENLVARLLKARSTENLLESVAGAIEAELAQSTAHESPDLERARRELAEVRSRFE